MDEIMSEPSTMWHDVTKDLLAVESERTFSPRSEQRMPLRWRAAVMPPVK